MENREESILWEILYYIDSQGRCPFQIWFSKDLNRIQQIALHQVIKTVLLEKVTYGFSTPQIKSLGEGLYEFRLSMSQKEIERLLLRLPDIPRVTVSKILLRVFYTLGPNKKIVVLSGYDKLAHSSKRFQQKEINRAKMLRREWKRL